MPAVQHFNIRYFLFDIGHSFFASHRRWRIYTACHNNVPKFYNHLNEWLNLIPMSLGAGKYEFLHQYGSGNERP